MGKEIERKFLMADKMVIPIPKKHQKLFIKQGYLFAEKGKQIRIRLINGKAKLGIKYTKNIVRDEYEYDIPYTDGVELLNKCKYTLEKNRISFKIGKTKFDCDTFTNGLQVIEVEYKTVDDLSNWEKPKWLGVEVTKNNKFSNIKLAKNNEHINRD